jgi:hypothetical protein
MSISAAYADPASVIAEYDRVLHTRGSTRAENLLQFVDAHPNVSEAKPLRCELVDLTGKCEATPGDCFQSNDIQVTSIEKGQSRVLVQPTLRMQLSVMGLQKSISFAFKGMGFQAALNTIHNEERTQVIATQSLNLFSDGKSLVGEFSILVLDGAPNPDPELFDWVRKAPFSNGDFGRRVSVFQCQ